MKINKNYKNSVFTALFGNEEKIIELYGAIEGKQYPKSADVKINTLQEALFMDRMNDVSFTIDDKVVVLVEHQSTINENMPLRALYYISRLYEKIIDSKKIYRKSLVKIPTPEFIVLYNGTKEYPDKCKLKLSDAFKTPGGEIELELIVNVFNINKGHNAEIAERSKTLDDYVSFIDMIRESLKSGKKLAIAIKEAINFCIENDILRDFLKKYGSEVANMLNVEWNWDDAIEVAREEAMEECIEKVARNLKESGTLSLEQISQASGLSVEEIEKL